MLLHKLALSFHHMGDKEATVIEGFIFSTLVHGDNVFQSQGVDLEQVAKPLDLLGAAQPFHIYPDHGPLLKL